ncbi:MAG: chromosomal replication initiator protein DnaA [Patescibacteria group bacterium]
MNPEQLWQAVLGELELEISRANFTTWFKHTFIAESQNQRIVIGVPNDFTKSWLENKYHHILQKVLQHITDQTELMIEYQVVTKKSAVAYAMETHMVVDAIIPPPSAPRPTAPQSPSSIPPLEHHQPHPKYSFENFIVGKGNELARAACTAVAERPGLVYNPLFLYGGVGLGKTHLMQAIGNTILHGDPSKKVLYVTCETFTNEFIEKIRQGKSEEFKRTYRNVDILLIDDIQFLANKEQTQEEFFHTFNTLHQAQRQIVVSSDRPPKAISSLEKRLISRFECGMIADISSPDFETRLAILMKKCQDKGLHLSQEILEYIANNIQNNVRELEGALNKVMAYQDLNRIPPTLETTKQILSSLTQYTHRGALTAKQLIQTVSEFFDISIADLIGDSRKKELVLPRQISIFLMREEMKSSFPTIGSVLGGRDHTTAMHGYNKISKEITNDEKMRQDIDLIRQRLYAAG